jgi:uncharacterized sulfatase
MKSFTPTTLLSLLLVLVASVAAQAERPNVVFLLSDDHGWNDYGFMGHPHVQTPNIDRLARAGLVYERGYVTAPLCRPSLASMVTGMYPHQTGIRGNDPVLPKGVNRKAAASRATALPFRNRMTAPMSNHPSFVKELKAHGYATLQTGKWWEGNPLDHGFTDAMTHGDLLRGGRHGDEGLKIGRNTMKPIYDFVDKADANDQPFFIWYGVFLPHAPHNAPDRLFNKYKDIAPDEPTARYWANIEWLDEGCGQIIEYLKEKDLYKNTIFIYTCDNGWVQDPKRTNASIRSKQFPVEAGIRTPIFVTHEGTIEPLRDKETLASNIDIATTILKACDIDTPPAMQGLDLRQPDQLQERNRVFVDVYEHDSNLDQLADLNSGLKSRVVINGWDKLITRPDGNELYDLQSDPDDRTDISSQNPQKVRELLEMIDQWVGKAVSQ